MPAVAPSGVGSNEHYNTDEAFFLAVGAALHTEYQAIVDAGLILQIDDPFLSDLFGDPALDAAQRHARAEMYVEAINASLRGHPAGACALSHVLRHQPRPAHPRGGAGGRRRATCCG